jgi:hypothetical protein
VSHVSEQLLSLPLPVHVCLQLHLYEWLQLTVCFSLLTTRPFHTSTSDVFEHETMPEAEPAMIAINASWHSNAHFVYALVMMNVPKGTNIMIANNVKKNVIA